MAQHRLVTLKDEEVYKALLKIHVKEEPSHSTKVWQSSDMDLVVSHFSGFLSVVALTGQRINETVLAKCFRWQFKSGPTQCKLFAQRLKV